MNKTKKELTIFDVKKLVTKKKCTFEFQMTRQLDHRRNCIVIIINDMICCYISDFIENKIVDIKIYSWKDVNYSNSEIIDLFENTEIVCTKNAFILLDFHLATVYHYIINLKKYKNRNNKYHIMNDISYQFYIDTLSCKHYTIDKNVITKIFGNKIYKR